MRSISRVAVLSTLLAAISIASPAHADNPVTPGNITGYGFDQCHAPTQAAMDAWLNHSPYWAVGIYTSGYSRACRNQPNLTPEWVARQLAAGWRLLPINLGPQASCNGHFPRYGNDVRIYADPANTYAKARAQGRASAIEGVAAAKKLGIVAKSTLWYDLEAFNIRETHCRESALWFLSAYTRKTRALGYVSGVYSSAATGLKALDQARRDRPGTFTLPDQIWIADWDRQANTSSAYLAADGWLPGGRMKQYRGGHVETWGGVSINIDNNWLDLGAGSVVPPKVKHCGVNLNFAYYVPLAPLTGSTSTSAEVRAQTKALQCFLTKQGFFKTELTGRFGQATRTAVRAWQQARGYAVEDRWRRQHWAAILAYGADPVLKFGSARDDVRRLQRALNASTEARLPITGLFASMTADALRNWQSATRQRATGVANPATWDAFGRTSAKRPSLR